jgi:Ice-binding-like/Putative Ig domain
MKRAWLRLAVSVGCAAILCGVSTAWAQVAPPLGAAQQFGALGNSAVTGATGSGVVVTGDVGSSPTPTISNFPPSSTATPFIVHNTNDGVVQQAHTDAIAAYNALLVQGPGTVLPDNLATVGALGPGIYSFVSGAPDLPASATLTLNGTGIFIFNVASSLTANVLSNVVGTANPCNIYWRVGTSATLNGTNFRGTVIADASITLGAGANLAGRALAGTGATGAVTMAGSGGNTIGGCSAPILCPVITIAPPTTPNGTVGTAYTQTFTASGGAAPFTFSVTAGVLPPGLTLTPAGVLAGTPTTAGTSTFTIRATDANGCFAEAPYTLIVIGAVPTLPQVFVLLLALGLAALGYVRLRRRGQMHGGA